MQIYSGKYAEIIKAVYHETTQLTCQDSLAKKLALIYLIKSQIQADK